mmetsp:Transcript_51598/g.95494  ORF Transcript_51598/g.95494 Transcript_51598/m.95494 type:complete len:365 (-) Transcript_51598:148-1242(-)
MSTPLKLSRTKALYLVIAACALVDVAEAMQIEVGEDLYGASVSEIQEQLRSRGYALTKVTNVLSALENIDVVLPPDSNGGTFFYDGGYFSRHLEGQGVYGVGSSNASIPLAPHNEMGYGPRTPSYITFGARQAATGGGGDTLLIDGHEVYKNLDPKHQLALQQRKVRYRVRFDDSNDTQAQTSWRRSFPGSTTPEEAAQIALRVGYHGATVKGSSMHTIFDAYAVVAHPVTGLPCLFDQIVGAHGSLLEVEAPEARLKLADRLHHTTWAPEEGGSGDEEELETDIILPQVAALQANLTVAVPIPTGHILIVDNVWHKHGRTAHGGDRDVLVTMRGAFRGSCRTEFSKEQCDRSALSCSEDGSTI